VEKTTYQGALCSVLLTKYYFRDQMKNTKMGRACSTYGESRGACRVLVGKPEVRRPLSRPNRRWEDNIKMDRQEVCFSHGLVRSSSGQVTGSCKCGDELAGFIKL
jgi:hypothetical protein